MPLFRAESSDLPAVADLVNSAYRGDSSRQGWATEADLLGGQRTDAEALKDDLDARPDARLLMLKDAPDGELLGCVWLEPYKQATWYMGMAEPSPEGSMLPPQSCSATKISRS